jgi:hypothetical protein
VHPAGREEGVQEELIALCARLSGIAVPRA